MARIFLLALAAFAICRAQQSTDELKARTLFYQEQPEAKPASRPSTKAASSGAERHPKPPVESAAETKPAPAPQQRPPAPGAAQVIPASEIQKPVMNLGVRYTLLLVDDNNREQPVDSDRVFHNGECFALRLESNRAGYLYVLGQGTSGAWQALLPSALMPEERNVIAARTPVRIPAEHCYQITEPAGAEHLFVVLTRDPADFYNLQEGIRGGHTATPPAQAPDTTTTMASAKELGTEMERIRQEFRSRDLIIKKVARPLSADEPAHAVYVVNASSTPASRVVTEILVHHR